MPLLVLWDIDQTLLEARGAGRDAYAAAFHRLTGRPLDQSWQFHGRTDLAAATGVLRLHGVEPTPARVRSFVELITEELHARADDMRRRGRVLPGAAAALEACRAVAGVHQSVLTGNVAAIAALKLRLFGLAEHLDLRIGAFGDDAFERIDLPPHAWQRADRYLGHRFTGADTVIIGDTLLDVAAGRAAGARTVAVATGPVEASALRDAGADVVLPDLADTAAVLNAIVQPSAA